MTPGTVYGTSIIQALLCVNFIRIILRVTLYNIKGKIFPVLKQNATMKYEEMEVKHHTILTSHWLVYPSGKSPWHALDSLIKDTS
jgi:hypothetical protein